MQTTNDELKTLLLKRKSELENELAAVQMQAKKANDIGSGMMKGIKHPLR